MSEKPREQEPQPEEQPFEEVQKVPLGNNQEAMPTGESEQSESVFEQKLEAEKFLINILTRVPPQEERDDISFIVHRSHSLGAGTEFSENWGRFLSGSLMGGGEEVAEKISSVFTEKINERY